jgi:energy-coupling factor transporter transmembrane protein EcfT
MATNPDERPDLLTRLTRLNPRTVVIATVALFLGVLLLPDPVGGVLILVIVAGLGLLLRQTWPVLAPATRALRLVIIALLVAIALVKLL